MRRVLLADDEPWTVKWVADFIRKEWPETVWVIEPVVTGQELIDLLSKNPPLDLDLIVIDLTMLPCRASDWGGDVGTFVRVAQETGLKLCKWIRTERGLSAAQLPVVAYSVQDSATVRQQLASLGVSLFAKGDNDPLREELRNILGRRS